MDEKLRISVIMHMEGVNRDFFRDFLESLAQNTYKNFELVITDAGVSSGNGEIAGEFFPEKGKLIYRKIKPGRTRGYALNYALSAAKGDVFVFVDRHSRLSPIMFFEIIRAIEKNGADLVYPDNDELVGPDRMNPDFKPGANRELIRHRNYIGDCFAITKSAMESTGIFKDSLSSAACYDLLLRAFEKDLNIYHVPKLLYSKRILKTIESQKARTQRVDNAYKEHMAVAGAHLARLGIEAQVKSSGRQAFWNIEYDSAGYRSRRRDYLVLRDADVKTRLRDSLPKLYAMLKQPDVGIVGGAMLSGRFSFDNCGYIFDKNGITFPACCGQSIFYEGYNYRCILPMDVSMVDFGFCLIKRKLYKGLNGFDKSLTGRDAMLDFCLRAKRAGYRTVFVPGVRARKKKREDELTDSSSNEQLVEKWGELLELGDPYYNKNLPMGIDNYFLY